MILLFLLIIIYMMYYSSSSQNLIIPENSIVQPTLSLPSPTGNYQFLSTDNSGNIIWQNQCCIAGLDNQILSVKNGGVIVNIQGNNGCLRTLSPNGTNQVLFNDINNSISWIDSTLLSSGGTITSIGTSNGLTVGGIAGTTITTSGILGLDGWEIYSTNKVLRPKVSLMGSLGDPTHVITNANLSSLILYNGFNTQTINTSATAPYTWNLPSGTPTITSILTSDVSGNIGYLTAGAANDVLITTSTNTLSWIQQCSFAGLNNEVTSVPFSSAVFGVVVNNGATSNCLNTVNPGANAAAAANKILSTDAGGNITWTTLSTILPSSGVTSVGTSNGLTVNGVAGGTIITTGTLGLDGWEIVTGSKIFRPQVQSGNVNQGKLGDPLHIIEEINLNNLILFNSGFSTAHTIMANPSSSYQWITPSGNPLITSLVNCTSSGQLGYIPSTSGTQILTSQGVGNSPLWVEECYLNGLNNEVSTVPFSLNVYGVVVNNGATSNCLNTVNPGINAATAANKILVTDINGDITWISQTSITPNSVTSVGTSNGLTVNGVAGGTITTTGTLGLDGWEIVTGSKIFRPQVQSGNINEGKLGDSTHIIEEINLNNLILFNNALTFSHTISSGATASYMWTTPSGNPSFTTIISCAPTGQLGYLNPTSATQVLVSTIGNVPTWIEQCTFGGLSNKVSNVSFNTNTFGVVINTGGASNCLTTLNPGATAISASNKILATDGSGNITWINQSGGGTVTSIGTSNGLTVNGVAGGTITTTGTLGLDGWEIVMGSKILRPQVQSGNANQGKLGDSGHIINQINANSLILYDNSNTYTHTFVTSATSPYTWTTPSSNPTTTSLLMSDTSGNLQYSPATSQTQILTSQGVGNSPIWIEQCTFAGLNDEVTSVPFSLNVYGVVVNTGSTSNCLTTLNPGSTAGAAANQVLMTDGNGNITWNYLISLPFATSVGTADGLTVNGVAGGTITTTGTIGLDGWEIVTGSKILRPKLQSGNTNQGILGDSLHIIEEINVNNLILWNSAFTFAHTIQSSASAAYTWMTPIGNPSTTTSLLSCTTSGQLTYVTPGSATQVLTSQGVGNAPIWIEQCTFAGLSNIITSVSFAEVLMVLLLITQRFPIVYQH